MLDVYEAVAAQAGNLPPWTLVIEHALLSNAATRARAVRGGFGVTVQHPLLWNMGSEMLTAWGPDRTSQVGPLDEWLAAGASLAAGTDIARPFNPMTAVWGMVTRGTKSAGIQGPAHAIDVATALELYTMGSARLNDEADHLGTISPGKLADLVAYPADPFTADTDVLAALGPPSPSSAGARFMTRTGCSALEGGGLTRIEATATCLSWIPPTAVEGVFGLPFGLGIAHYDKPPPDATPDVGALLAADAIRFANQLRAWIEVEDGRSSRTECPAVGGSAPRPSGSVPWVDLRWCRPADLTPPAEVYPDRVRFTQTAGGHTGLPCPGAVTHPPFWRLTAPVAWSTITLTLHADGSSKAQLTAREPVPAPLPL